MILAGDVYVDAICSSIEQSRNVLFIITDSFCDRNWGHYEIERAKYEKFTRKSAKGIVTTMTDVNKAIPISSHISLLQLPKYL
jgi:hypothetical protein